MTPSVVELARAEAVPWLNGGGITRDLLTWPAPDDWAVRVSVADIARNGPFSSYPGVQRWFAVAEGDGVRLGLPERSLKLTVDSPPVEFDGAATPGCSLLGGPTRDLNLMCRRHRAEGRMVKAQAGIEHVDAAPLRAVFVMDAARLQVDGGPGIALPAGSLAWTPSGARQRWKLSSKAYGLRAWWIDVET